MDTLLLAVGDKGVILQESGVSLNLVGSRHNTGGLNNSIDVLNGEVGYTNVLDLGLGQGNQGLPGVHEGDAVVQGNLIGLLLGRGKQGRADVSHQGEGDRPVDEVQVEVVELELGEGVVQGLLDDLGAVGVVPQLGGDEEILSLETKVLETLVKTLGDLLLVLVDLGQIEMTVSRFQGLVDADRDLTGLRLPCSVAESAILPGKIE